MATIFRLVAFSFLLAAFLPFGEESKDRKKEIYVYVDERMELLTIVQYLAGYSLLGKSKTAYKAEIDRYFSRYKQHPAITTTRAMFEAGYFYGSSAPWYLYQFSFPQLQPAGIILAAENQIEDYEQHKDTLDLYREQLKDFYKSSAFKNFFISQKPFYDSLVNPVKQFLKPKELPRLLENHYGQKKRSYNIVLSPLLHDGGYGLDVKTKKGDDVYGVIGPVYDSTGKTRFDTSTILQYYILHEFSHSFCNPVISKQFTRLKEFECLINPIIKEQISMGYGGDWETCLYEHLVRANEVILTKSILSTETAAKVFDEYYNRRKWIYLPGLIRLIEET